jgi:hypothetical protein
VRRETEFDRKVRAFLKRAVAPSLALILSGVVFAICAWCFLVVFAGWPRSLAAIPYFLCMFASPALSFVILRELWRVGWNARMFFAALLSIASFAFWCATIYFVIYGRAA